MLAGSKSTARALDATADAADLLALAQKAVQRAQVEVDGNAHDVADRLSQQLQYLRKVAEVLRHEIGCVAHEEGGIKTCSHAAPPRTNAVVRDKRMIR